MADIFCSKRRLLLCLPFVEKRTTFSTKGRTLFSQRFQKEFMFSFSCILIDKYQIRQIKLAQKKKFILFVRKQKFSIL